MRLVMGVLFSVASVLALGSLLAPTASSQETPPPDLAVRQAELEKLVAKHETSILELQKRMKDLEDRLKSHDAWVRSVPSAIKSLRSGVDQSESQGFTKAGANIDARESLLTALRNFGQELEANVPAVPAKSR